MTDLEHISLAKTCVRLFCPITSANIGTGVVYFKEDLNNILYILTASHCLFEDGDCFTKLRNAIRVDFYSPLEENGVSVLIDVNQNLVSKDATNDVAILIIEKEKLGDMIVSLPSISILKERNNITEFVVKGFPNATKAEEIRTVYPTFIQPLSNDNRFQLQLNEQYSDSNVKGFSGSGVFTIINSEIYLYGVIARYTNDEKGKLFYCQYSSAYNDILRANYLPDLEVGFVGSLEMNFNFFKNNIADAKVSLGARFREEINFKLPIAKLFNDIAKDNIFHARFLKILDDWLLDSKHFYIKNNPALVKIDTAIDSANEKMIAWAKTITFDIDVKIEFDWLVDELNLISKEIEGQRSVLYDLQKEAIEKNKNEQKFHSYNRPYESEINKAYQIERSIDDFIYNLNETICVSLSNNPFLILDGNAGNGKSHLFGDIATDRINRKLPTLLLLGQKFNRQGDVWLNVLAELGLQCNKSEFLGSVNSIGRQIGSRVLILIDAINEGAGKELWESRIANFLEDFKAYPFIAIALSIRTTYKQYIIPDEVIKNRDITFRTHQGFLGNEYEALNRFCIHYQLEQPSFPIMSPEYTNPLFLHLICEALQTSSVKLFPKGSQGINKIFQLYVDSIQAKFSKKNAYKNRPYLILNAISKFSQKCHESNLSSLSLDDANELFDHEFSRFDNLLTDLIEESILIKNVSHYYDSDDSQQKEYLYFAFQRFGDFYIAKQLLKDYSNKDEVLVAFKENGILGNLVKEGYWNYRGVLEAFSTLLPELFSLELFEVYSWVFSHEDHNINSSTDYIASMVLDSLEWRIVDSIDNTKITKWLKQHNANRFSYNEYLNTIIKFTAINNHPFNSDRLFRILNRINMPKRDSFWQEYLRYYNGYNDVKIAYPIRRLIDWAWTPNISTKIDFETARHTGQTLAWVLATTNRVLRDETTKALVNLLEQQTDALLSILKAFRKIDDNFILERLFAVCYGCILRTEKLENIKKIAQYVYDTIFKKGEVPKDILLRDYAKNSVEFGIYKNVGLKIDKKKIEPPYNSPMPKSMPTKEDLLKYKMEVKDENTFDGNYGRMNNRIFFDVVEWDFGSKEVEPNLHQFSLSRFTFEQEYKDYRKKLNNKQKAILKCIITNIETKSILQDRQYVFENRFGKKCFEEQINFIDSAHADFLEKYKNEDASSFYFIENEVVPYFQKKYEKRHRYNEFNSKPILYWIVQRVFELGYDSIIHGEFDSSIERHYYDTEYSYRIGEKYQWIAYFEILGIISDNYKISDDYYKLDFYKGSWQLYLRNINPSFITKVEKEKEANDLGLLNEYTNWWDNIEYSYWNQPNSEWVNNLDDLPKPEFLIDKKDEGNNNWLILKTFKDWKEPKLIGQDKYGSQRKNIWYKINSFLIKKSDKSKILDWLSKQNFWGNWLPESKQSSYLFNREKYWSPAYLDTHNDIIWEQLEGSKFKVIITTSEANGSISEDKSDAHTQYDMPCKTIYDGMQLMYATTDGEFKGMDGEIVVLNKEYKACMIKKEALLSFLEENDLEIIWTVLSEKSAYSNNLIGSYSKTFSGVYQLEENKIVGKMSPYDRE